MRRALSGHPQHRAAVSIHAPAWGATREQYRDRSRTAAGFNPRTRVGCDPTTMRRYDGGCGFNPRTRVGCDDHAPASIAWPIQVSIHAPAWGATIAAMSGFFHSGGFNPRTRVGCDGRMGMLMPIGITVSIHAPAWGATWGRGGMGAPWEGVSIHAPAWGATWPAWRCGSRSRCFNPRTRVGCDTSQVQSLPFEERVSIHAPAWGATPPGSGNHTPRSRFNPRTRVGCDPSTLTWCTGRK